MANISYKEKNGITVYRVDRNLIWSAMQYSNPVAYHAHKIINSL